MGYYRSPPDLIATIKKMQKQLQALANTQQPPTFTTAGRPTSSQVNPGTIIFVSDAVTGSQFQGWNGSSWVSLG